MKYKNLTSCFLLFLLQVAVFYTLFRFLFPFKEQLQMFQFTGLYAATTLKQAGGAALYISEFISQFYAVVGIGAVSTALLLALVALLSVQIIKKISMRNGLPFITLLPWLALFLMHLDYDYLEQGTIAYLFLLLFLAFYIQLRPKIRFVYAICFLPVLYLIAGPVVHLFAGCALLFEFLTHGENRYSGFLYLFVAVLTAIAGTYFGYSRNLEFAFLPEAYYDPKIHVSKIYYSWFALPTAMLLAAWFKKYKEPVRLKGKWISEGLQIACLLFFTYEGILHFGRLETRPHLEQDYYIRHEKWDKVLAAFEPTLSSKHQMCGINLALAHTGRLADCLLDYPQGGIETLLLRWDQTLFTAEMHSDLYYCMGIISTAQKFAFEAFVSSRPSGNPRMLKRLVETNLITGAYATAEKYIRILENTWYYRQWATSQRLFLYNDKAVLADQVLGLKRRCWEAERAANRLYTDPVSSLTYLVQACPQNRAGLQYLTSFLLLNKDIQTYKALQEKVYRTPAWPEMSICQQEAVVVGSPNNPRYWLEHGVSLKVRNRSFAFMDKVKANARQSNLTALLAPEYGRSYWYYYMFYNK